MMVLVRKMELDQVDAKELLKVGFVLRLTALGNNKDTYEVYAINSDKEEKGA